MVGEVFDECVVSGQGPTGHGSASGGRVAAHENLFVVGEIGHTERGSGTVAAVDIGDQDGPAGRRSDVGDRGGHTGLADSALADDQQEAHGAEELLDLHVRSCLILFG